MRDALRGLLDLLLPPSCAGCAGGVAGDRALCAACDRELPRAEALPAPPGLAACVAATELRGAAEVWIHRFKYPPHGLAGLDPAPLAVARALAREAARRAPGPRPDLVVPVALHPRRLRSRGFNPAGLLARTCARELRAPCDPVALRRLRDTPSQTHLDRRARRRNVRGAFAARRRVPATVWLVDDVVTTGATLSAAASALKRAGAHRIVGVCAAWTPL